MKRVAVLNVVGLSESLLGPATPRLQGLIRERSLRRIRPALPAVTCTAQANYLTGCVPREHGVVANGWFHRELVEVHFWKQSNRLVGRPKIWEALKQEDPTLTCANLFWWFNMHSTVDWSITPRPMYPADGRKVFDVHSWPYELGSRVKKDLGEFPFFGFWGPAAGLDTPQGGRDVTTRWIANAARWIEEQYSPTLNLVYLPHLDYNLQRLGPGHPDLPQDLQLIDSIVGDLLDFFQRRSVEVIVLSEYGMSAVTRPIHLNRVFRDKGWLTVKEELGLELLDTGASRVFAVADHQAAHIYVNDSSLLGAVRTELESIEGIQAIWDAGQQQVGGLNHSRSGDLVAFAASDSWFTYYYWQDDTRAPDFARTVDIHRKPGFDPVELFIDPALSAPKLHIARRLLQKKLGFRMLMDVIPLDATLVRGSHGALPADTGEWPVVIAEGAADGVTEPLESTDIFGLIKNRLTGPLQGPC